jgi:hypothetical protein
MVFNIYVKFVIFKYEIVEAFHSWSKDKASY